MAKDLDKQIDGLLETALLLGSLDVTRSADDRLLAVERANGLRSGHLNFAAVAPPGIKSAGYAETTFVGMGSLIALVVGDDLPDVDFNVGTFSNLARRIWPTQRAFKWPLSDALTDPEANAAANILSSMIANFRQR